jgi:hypothetical protein
MPQGLSKRPQFLPHNDKSYNRKSIWTLELEVRTCFKHGINFFDKFILSLPHIPFNGSFNKTIVAF